MTTHVSEFRVRYAETDQMGVVYHANYLVWCEIGRTDFIRVRCGKSYAELEREGVLLAVAEASLRYHASARYDDLVRVETTLTAARSRLVRFDYAVFNAATGQRLVTADSTLLSMDRDGRATSLPQEFRATLEALL